MIRSVLHGIIIAVYLTDLTTEKPGKSTGGLSSMIVFKKIKDGTNCLFLTCINGLKGVVVTSPVEKDYLKGLLQCKTILKYCKSVVG